MGEKLSPIESELDDNAEYWLAVASGKESTPADPEETTESEQDNSGKSES